MIFNANSGGNSFGTVPGNQLLQIIESSQSCIDGLVMTVECVPLFLYQATYGL
jgi:hypothetical protein